eukprot:GEMP01100593.1.p1 GENE.GEMP01100593.1~~GEMP01100593.1.p1  ORF type:complete len:149 (+),score=32.27 GEMP01100593.1:292-738(+)
MLQNQRKNLAQGQTPFAVILACADSRVAPELIFDADLGEIFVIRVAGNVVNSDVFASAEYAVNHLGSPLVVCLGHTKCGAVAASASTGPLGGHLPNLVAKILPAMDESDPIKANVLLQLRVLQKGLGHKASTIGAVYDLESGQVQFIE